MRLVVLLTFSLAASWVEATVTTGHICPDEFEGRIRAIVEETGPDNGFSAQKIVVENMGTVRGNVSEQLTFEILKNGPFKVESGKEYRVQLRKGKLCWIEQI